MKKPKKRGFLTLKGGVGELVEGVEGVGGFHLLKFFWEEHPIVSSFKFFKYHS